jgi:NAD(P)-dependent dehydrogenase (short-subunit alcohol dehydrogenase family)
VTLEVAGPAPLAAVTAIAAIDSLGLSPGQSVLVVGATGGVGSVAAQLAAHAGTRVIAPAHPADEPYLRELEPSGNGCRFDRHPAHSARLVSLSNPGNAVAGGAESAAQPDVAESAARAVWRPPAVARVGRKRV